MTRVSTDRAFSTYNNLSKSIDSASPDDTEAYKDWIAKHTPIIDSEAAFLDQSTDLATIITRKGARLEPLEPSVMASGFAVLLTIIAFKLVPQFCSRLVVGSIVGMAMVYSGSSPAVLEARSLPEFIKCVSM